MIVSEYKIIIEQGRSLPDNKEVPIQEIIITEDQKFVIEQFADIKRDKHLNNIYKINKIEFSIEPIFSQVFLTNKDFHDKQ